jgi:hypothetical protein
MTENGRPWPDIEITDEYMSEMRSKSKAYTIVLLRRTSKTGDADAWPTIWEHGRRNHQLRAGGIMPIVCPMPEDDVMAGVGIFDAEVDEVDRIMSDDPAVRAGLMTYTVHGCVGFPGDALTA